MRALFLLVILIVNAAASPLDVTEAKRIADLCDKMAEAALNERHDVVISMLYPEIISSAGGKERLAQMLAAESEKNRNAGVVVHSLNLSPRAEFYDGRKYRVVLVDSVLVMEVGGRKFRSTSFQIAFRELSGSLWYLLDGTNLRDSQFRRLFQGLPTSLKLPEISRIEE